VVSTLTGQTDWVLSVAISPDGLLVAGSDRFGGVRVWEMQTGRLFWNLRGHTGAVTAVAWGPDADQLLTAGQDGTAQVWNLHTGEQAAVWEPGLGGLQNAVWHESGLIALSGRDHKAALLNVEGRVLQTLSMSDEATEMAFRHDGRQLLVADAAGRIVPFDVATGKPGNPFGLPVAAVAAREETPWPSRTRAVAVEAPPTPVSASGHAEDELLQALIDAEAAVQSAEQSLARLREHAARLRKVLAERQPPSK
jgi:WD40 repeat protein